MTDKEKVKYLEQIIEKSEKEDTKIVQTLVRELQATIKKYKELAAQTTKLNNEYKSHIKEIKDMKAKYKKEMSKFVNGLK